MPDNKSRDIRARANLSFLTILMISIPGILEHLFQEGEYNYRWLLEDLCCGQNTEDINFQNTVNTVELFAFGDYVHHLKYRSRYIDLPVQGIRKLTKITLISMFNANEGINLSYDEVIRVNCLELALKQFSDASVNEQLQEMLIEMADEGSMQVQIDEASRTFVVTNLSVARDAYNDKTYTLRVLQEGDINSRSVSVAREKLAQWVAAKLDPSIHELRSTQSRA